MNYTTVTSPAYASADSSAIACMVQFDGFSAPVPFVAHATDSEEHGQQLYRELTALKYGQIAAYAAPAPSPSQQYAAAIALGLAVISESIATLNATYSVSPANTADMLSEAASIAAFQTFTNGETKIDWPDASGAVHTFPSPALFMGFAKAAAAYVTGCKQAFNTLSAGSPATFPSNSALIG